MPLKDQYFTVSEAAKKIGVTRQTISRWIKEGSLPTEKLGRAVLIKKDIFQQPTTRKLLEVKRRSLEGQLISFIKEQFNYTDNDKIFFMGFDEGLNWLFSVKINNKKQETVRVRLGIPETLTRKKEEGFIYEGIRYEIKSMGRLIG